MLDFDLRLTEALPGFELEFRLQVAFLITTVNLEIPTSEIKWKAIGYSLVHFIPAAITKQVAFKCIWFV